MCVSPFHPSARYTKHTPTHMLVLPDKRSSRGHTKGIRIPALQQTNEPTNGLTLLRSNFAAFCYALLLQQKASQPGQPAAPFVSTLPSFHLVVRLFAYETQTRLFFCERKLLPSRVHAGKKGPRALHLQYLLNHHAGWDTCLKWIGLKVVLEVFGQLVSTSNYYTPFEVRCFEGFRGAEPITKRHSSIPRDTC